MLKNELRKKYLEKRKALSDDEALKLSKEIFKLFTEKFSLKTGDKIHVFLPISKFKEINTHAFISYCFDRQIRVYVPKTVKENLISVEVFPNSEFEHHKWGIPEPVSSTDADVTDFNFVITPLLYCDSYGNRIGYGKGYYDRFFSTVSSETLKIGVNYFLPEETIDDVDFTDITLDYLVTPTEILSFGKGSE